MRKKCVGILTLLAGISFLIMGVSCSSGVNGTKPSDSNFDDSGELFMGFENVISISGDTSVEKVSDKIYSVTEDTTIKFSGSINAVLLKTVMAAMQVNDSVNFALDLSDTTGITEWKKDWFEGSESLYAISLPKTVTTIQNASFADCINLKAVTVPCKIESYPSLGTWCIINFSGSIAEWLQSPVIVPDNKSLYLNGKNKELTNISIPTSVTKIKEKAFYGYSGLTCITIPSNVEQIGNNAFYGCSALKEVIIEDGDTNLAMGYNKMGYKYDKGEGLFYGCPLDSIYIGRQLSFSDNYHSAHDLGYSPFAYTTVSSVKFGNSIAYIDDYMFIWCSNLKTIDIPKSVKSIGKSVFKGCNNLENISLPEGITIIGEYTFEKCSSLKSITIPSGVTSIGENAFSECSALTNVTIPDSVTTIGESAFSECSALTNVTIPESVTTIGESAFNGCSNLKEVIIPSNVEIISENAFKDCSQLKSVILPANALSIDENAFNGCKELSSITIPNKIEVINSGAFNGCTSLTKLIISDGTSSLWMGTNKRTYNYDGGNGLFYDCPLDEVYIGRELSYNISSLCGFSPFAKINTINSVSFGNSLKGIENYLFYKCENLSSVLLPESITSIGAMTFAECNKLTTVYYQGNEEQWNAINIGNGNDSLKQANFFFDSTEVPDDETNNNVFYSVSYMNEKGDAPNTFQTTEGTVLSTIQLPEMTCEGYKFLGWYSDTTKVTPDEYTVQGNITLTAKWQLERYSVIYELNDGTNHAANPSSYTIESSAITLQNPVRTGYDFGGWFITKALNGSAVESIGGGTTGEITLYAKWIPVVYKITYELNGGTNATSNPATYTIESDTITLAEPQKEGFVFDGWYTDISFNGTKQTTIEKGSHDDKKYYAQWLKKCTVSYSSDHGSVPDSFYVASGTTLTAENLPSLTESGWKFLGWYTNSNYDEDKKVSIGQTVITSIMLYAKWEEYTEPDDGFVFVEGGTVVGSADYNQMYTGVFPAGRTVTLSDFYMCDHELTQGEYETFCWYTGSAPSLDYGVGADYPAYNVSWYDAIVYCNLKSMAEGLIPCYTLSGETDPKKWKGIRKGGEGTNGKYSGVYGPSSSNWESITCNMKANGYRLPTEAEWEYAARGGQKTYGTSAFENYFAGATTTDYYSENNSDLDSVGWYKYNICNNGVTGIEASSEKSGYGTHKIKTKSPNALGLYDMSGNVSEWCWDRCNMSVGTGYVTNPCGALIGSSRTLRGGNWYSNAWECSVSCPGGIDPYCDNSDIGFRLVRSANNDSNNTESGNSNINQSYSLTSTVIVLPTGTNGTAGTNATYVLFGDWPQTIKADDVTINENVSEVHGAFTYYNGSDGYWYVKCTENAHSSVYTYSNWTTVSQIDANSTKYFKVEPIKWRVLTENYNGTEKALLLAENILTANAYYDYCDVNRTINGNTIYPNNYKESKIRAYLNGLSYYKQSSSSDYLMKDNSYSNKGFLQTAFTKEAQNLIATTIVDNSAESTTDSGNNLTQATDYVCANTNDKIFLLSEKEVTTSNYGFASYNSYDNTRIKVPTDFAKANYTLQWSEKSYGGEWWLRSPIEIFYNFAFYINPYGYYHPYYFEYDNSLGDSYYYVSRNWEGIVPALTISLQ